MRFWSIERNASRSVGSRAFSAALKATSSFSTSENATGAGSGLGSGRRQRHARVVVQTREVVKRNTLGTVSRKALHDALRVGLAQFEAHAAVSHREVVRGDVAVVALVQVAEGLELRLELRF